MTRRRPKDPGPSSSLLDGLLTPQTLKRLAGEGSYGRGKSYFDGGRVVRLTRRKKRLGAQVRGSLTYRIELWAERGSLRFSCTCPIGEERAFCKHCVAAGLAWLDPEGNPTGDEGVFDLDSLRGFLSRQEKDRLIELLLEQALADERLLRSLMVEMAKGRRGQRPDVAGIRRTLSVAFDTGDFIPYREVYGYARGLDEAIDLVEGLLKQGHAHEVIELAEHAMTLTEEALSHVDDSGGDVSGVLVRLQDLHLKACKKARPDPEALAHRLFAWETRTDWDTFYGAASTYAGVLGKKGLAVYRELAEAEWAKIPSRQPGWREEFNAKHSRLKSIMEGIARASGDLEALVAVKARDLTYAYSFLTIAQLYKEAGQDDRALEWAEKGARAFPQQTDSRLRTFLAEEYHARRRHDEAMALIWASFTDRPSLETYRALKKHAGRVKGWPAWREKALGFLRERAQKDGARARRSFGPDFGWGPGSTLVDILLWEKKTEAAWQEAQRFGCSENLWLSLAKQREQTHPEDSIPVYQRRVESVLQAGGGAYEEAVERLRQIHGLMKRLGRSEAFAAYLTAVRTANKRKRNFIRLLDTAKLG